MDINKMLNNVSNLSQYINISQDLLTDFDKTNVQLNVSAVLALKKLRSWEIEYLNKYETSGVAVEVFGLLLEQPASKTWGQVSKELISLLKYWLDALRKHLLNHSLNWWMFLKKLLRFIKIIRQKHQSIPNILVEETADCLLDLATHIKLNIQQRHEVLSCFNLYCADSSREVRVCMRSKLDSYFIKLGTVMSACGHFPTQHSILEAVLRWTIGRQDKDVRTLTAKRWFLPQLYSSKAIDFFLEKRWTDFFQDARRFLNLQNEYNRLVTSVICKKLTVGNVVVISGSERKETWLDINSKSKTMTVLLDPRYLDIPGSSTDFCYETLSICHSTTEDVMLTRELTETLIVLIVNQPLELYPSSAKIDCDSGRQVRVYVSSRSDPVMLDQALRTIFEEKYKLLLDLKSSSVTASPMVTRKKNTTSSDEESRFSHPEAWTTKSSRTGYEVQPAVRSQSTASTSSLAQLHEKLAALPPYRYNKEPVSVVADPDLSKVTELNESEAYSLNTTTSTFKLRLGTKAKKSRKSPSDAKIKDPTVHDEKLISCLLVATVGIDDDNSINEIIQTTSREKEVDTDDIVDLLVKEALQDQVVKDKSNDSGINTAEKKSQDDISEVVENTQFEDVTINAPTSTSLKKQNQTLQKVLENSTSSNESNTEELNEIGETQPSFVNTKIRNSVHSNTKLNENKDKEKLHIFDGEVVENFFSQNLSENVHGDLVLSPTLAKKINETSSESSDFDNNLYDDFNRAHHRNIVNEVDIVSCINDMLDRVCSDLDRCTEYLTRKVVVMELNDIGFNKKKNESVNIIDTDNKENEIAKTSTPQKKSTRQTSKIKIKHKIVPKKEQRTKPKAIKKKTNKLESETNTKTKMSTINELDEILAEEQRQVELASPPRPNDGSPGNDIDTPLLKRKRKLYSPKQDEIEIEKTVNKPAVRVPETEGEDTTLSGVQQVQNMAPTSLATPYKEIEKERKRIRKPRRTMSKAQSEPPQSPRTLKNNLIFDQMKDKVESNEGILIADKNNDIAIYNFSGDSEDEDFKKKTIEVSKRASTTTIGSFDSTISKRGRLTKRVTYNEKKSDSTTEETKPCKIQKRTKRQNARTKQSKPSFIPENELVDERMREAVDVLNTSLILQERTKNTHDEPNPIINASPEMEMIVETEPPVEKPDKTSKKLSKRTTRKTKQNEKKMVIKKEKNPSLKPDKEVAFVKDDEGSVSPLPCLVIETEANKNNNVDDSIRMMSKFRKIIKDGPNINITNTTQNLLSDIEQIDCTTEMNITEEVNRRFNDAEAATNKDPPIKQIQPSSPKKYNLRNKNNTKKPMKNSSVELITIRTISDVKSDKSIESAGITGHGDNDELPPSPEMLQEIFEPRNMELQDLDQSQANYFLKLRQEVNKSHSSSCESEKSKKVKSDEPLPVARSGNESPIVRLVRMPSGDIHEWLPPPPTTDSESEASEDDQNKPEKTKHLLKLLKRTTKAKETLQKNSKIEIEDTVKKVKEKEPKSLKKTTPKLPKLKNTPSSEIEEEEPQFLETKIPRTVYKEKREREPTKSPSPVLRPSSLKRKTTISPVNICFDDFAISGLSKLHESKEENLPEESSSNEVTGLTMNQSSECLKRYNLREILERSVSSISTDTKVVRVASPKKRKAPSKIAEIKKEKISVVEAMLIESGPSQSSVAEWFDKIPQACEAENEGSSLCEDSIRLVMEKLDTTLTEIHQNTSKQFINLFVDAQKQLQQQKDHRRQLYKETAKSILSNITEILDSKFCEMERRSQDLDRKFMENLKSRACEMVKDDCRQKRAMVGLLKEDLQAVADHLAQLNRKKH